MSTLVRKNEHFIGTFFYWMPSIIVLIFCKVISEQLHASLNGLQLYALYICIYTLVYVFFLRRIYIKRCVSKYVEAFLLFSIYSSAFLWCYYPNIVFFENISLIFYIEADSVKKIILIAYTFLIFEVANAISIFECKRHKVE